MWRHTPRNSSNIPNPHHPSKGNSMTLFFKLVAALVKYGKKAVAYAWAHKGTILKIIERGTTIGYLISYVLDRI
jgi:hypothetical protein